jgi:CubicO group peptidase (beta-lactamase class C family)
MPNPHRRLSFRVALLLLGLSLAPIATPAQSGLSAETLEKIERNISAEMSRQSVPGLSVAIVTDRELRWANGYGVADVENFVPARAATVYRLGSISKPITAAAVIQLWERGRIDLDAPVQKYCPAFPEKRWPVTTRELLGHLGGIHHYLDGFVENTRHYKSVVEGLDVFKDDPLQAEPGTKFIYSSFGYNLLGCVVEGASGEPFMNYLQEKIFNPAGMSTIQTDDVFKIIMHRTRGYQKLPDGTVANSELMDSSYKIPAGGLSSTVSDLAKFAIAMQKDVLVKPESAAMMYTSQKTRDGKLTHYGMGWETVDQDGVKGVAHGGGQSGTSTQLFIEPDKGFAIAIMCNMEGAHLTELAHSIARIVLQSPASE